MYSFNKLLVTLNHTDKDAELIRAASYVSKNVDAKEIHFINVIKDVNIPSSIKKEFPNIMKDALRDRKAEIERKIDQYFTNNSIKFTIEISSGVPTKAILKYSANHDIDLILLGKNKGNDGSVTINRIARRAACSLLIFPIGFNREIKKVLIPIDFSKHSVETLNRTLTVAAKGTPDLKIVAQNVYQVPSGYHYTGKSYQEFSKIMEENVKSSYEKFAIKLQDSPLKIEPLYTLDRHDNIISVIYETALKQRVDAIVISAKGRTSTTALFLGCRAEELIQLDSEIPLVVLRPKGQQDGILAYLKTI